MASGEVSKMTPMLASGSLPSLTGMEFTLGPTVTSMKDSGKCALSTDKVPISLYQVTLTPESTKTVSSTAKVSTNGPQERTTSAILSRVERKVTENGGLQLMDRVKSTRMRAIIIMTRNLATEHSYGPQATIIPVTILKMNAMVTEK